MQCDLLAFTLDDFWFGIDQLLLCNAFLVRNVAFSPDEAAQGILQGTLPTAIDLRVKFQLPAREQTDGFQVILLSLDHNPVALVLDEDTFVTRINNVTVSPPAGRLVLEEVVTGTAEGPEGPILVLNWAQFVQSPETINIRQLMPRSLMGEEPAQVRFLDAVMALAEEKEKLNREDIRALAQAHAIPLSVATHLVTFYPNLHMRVRNLQ